MGTDQAQTNLPILTTFPSPQEFEFARHLHSSVPASPVSPSVLSHNNRQSQDSVSHVLHANIDSPKPDISIIDEYFSPSPSPPSSRRTITPPNCPITTPHPLHTFVIPSLCRPCHITRDSNLARFEARVIRACVEREDVYREFGSENKHVHGYRRLSGGDEAVRRAKKTIRGQGRLVPLICVEEGRVRREIGWEMKERELRIVVGEDREGKGVGDENVVGESGSRERDVQWEGRTVGTVRSLSPASIVSQSTSAWASWWGRKPSSSPSPSPSPSQSLGAGRSKSSTESISSVRAPGAYVDAKTTALTMNEVVVGTEGSMGAMSFVQEIPAISFECPIISRDPSIADPKNDVIRDVAGRKGMQRILAWDSGRNSTF